MLRRRAIGERQCRPRTSTRTSDGSPSSPARPAPRASGPRTRSRSPCRSEVVGGLNLSAAGPGPSAVGSTDRRCSPGPPRFGILHRRPSATSRPSTRSCSGALKSRVAIEQAKGVLAERHDLELGVAFTRLRTHATEHRADLDRRRPRHARRDRRSGLNAGWPSRRPVDRGPLRRGPRSRRGHDGVLEAGLDREALIEPRESQEATHRAGAPPPPAARPRPRRPARRDRSGPRSRWRRGTWWRTGRTPAVGWAGRRHRRGPATPRSVPPHPACVAGRAR